MKLIISISFLAFLLYSPLAFGAVRELSDEHKKVFVDSCELWNVPLKLALAIARHESGLNPWAVNVAGQGGV